MNGRRGGLTQRALAGGFWTAIAVAGQAIFQIIALIILARLVSPGEFGLFAAALVVIGFSAIFAELGVGPAIVQRPTLGEHHLRAGFVLSLLLGAAISALIWTGAPAIAGFFHDSKLIPVLRAISVVFVFQSLSVVAQSLALRELRYRWLAATDAGAFAAGFLVTGPLLAWWGYGVWALVSAHITQHLVRTLVLLIGQPHPKRPSLEKRAIRELLDFGTGFTLARIGNYLAGQGDNLIVGRCLGPAALGFYGHAHQLVVAPAQLVGQVLDRVLFPAMAVVQLEPARLRRAYRSGLALCALIMLPVSLVLALIAPELVLVLLGPVWLDVVPPFQVLALGLLFRTSYKLGDSVARATGAVYARAWRQGIFALAVVTGSATGQLWGLSGVAVGVVAAVTLNFALMAHLSLRLTEMRWSEFGAAHLPAVALAAVIGVGTWVIVGSLRAELVSPFMLLVNVGFFAALATLLLCWSVPQLFLGKDAGSLLKTFLSIGPVRRRRFLPVGGGNAR